VDVSGYHSLTSSQLFGRICGLTGYEPFFIDFFYVEIYYPY
jgi:hypothetical protein